MIITNTSAGNFQVDGAYINFIAPPPTVPQGPPSGLIAIVGAANYGPVNTPTPFSDAGSLFSAFGNGTTLAYSLADEALQSMPECQQFLGVRVTDGTDTAATIAMLDAASATVLTLTNKYTGSYMNTANATFTLASGTPTVSPVLTMVINAPGVAAEVFQNIIAYATLGGTYNAATFQANALAAINGTLANKPGSVRWTATAGASTLIPVTNTTTTASGGTNGTTSLTVSTCVGTDGDTGRTGIYALRGTVQGGQVFIAQNTTASTGQTLVSFAQTENCSVWVAFPSLTSTPTATASRVTNNLIAPNLMLATDWDWAYDQVSQTTFLHSPIGPAAAVIAALPPNQYPGNKPAGKIGKIGIISTDRNGNPLTNPPSGVVPLGTSEAGKRQAAGILYLTNNPQLYGQNSGYGLPHGMASDGVTMISDTRMAQYVGAGLQAVLGYYVGSMIAIVNGQLVVIGPNNEPVNPQDGVTAFLTSLKTGNAPMLAAATNTISAANNTVQSTEGGFLIANVLAQTFSAAKYIIAFTQVGNTVNVPNLTITRVA